MQEWYAGPEIVTSWSPMRIKMECWRPEFQNWLPAGDFASKENRFRITHQSKVSGIDLAKHSSDFLIANIYWVPYESGSNYCTCIFLLLNNENQTFGKIKLQQVMRTNRKRKSKEDTAEKVDPSVDHKALMLATMCQIRCVETIAVFVYVSDNFFFEPL